MSNSLLPQLYSIFVKHLKNDTPIHPSDIFRRDTNEISMHDFLYNIYGNAFANAGLTKDQFRDAVIKERNLELAMEQVRWFDLKRTGKLKDVLTAAGLGKWNDKYFLFPIPQSEIDASNGLVKQNPGY